MYKKLKNFSSNNFRNDIVSQSWDDLILFEDPNEMWLAWKTLFLNVVDKHAPLTDETCLFVEVPVNDTAVEEMHV